MTDRHLLIGDGDLRRVENKINSALQQRITSRTNDGARDRIKGLHAFLEEVEGKDALGKSRDSLVSRDTTGFASKEQREAQQNAFLREQEYLGSLAQAKSTISTLNIELNATKHDLEAVKRALDDERSHHKSREEDLTRLLNAREEEFSTQITSGLGRQQETIAKLLADKQMLTDQVSSLASQLRQSDSKAKMVIDELKNKFRAEMKEAQNAWQAGEKAKRDKWRAEKEKEIKEITIRGLEPEVERMLSKQREEKTRMESETAEHLRKEKLRLETEYQNRLEEFKNRVLNENEAILRREKEFMQGHFESLAKEAAVASSKREVEIDARRAREVDEEREKRKKEADYWEQRLQQCHRDNLEHAAKLKAEFEVERQDWRARIDEERRRVAGISTEEEKLVRKRLEADLERVYKIKAEEARIKAVQERDEQIQMIVDRLLKEKAEEIEQAVQNERNKIKQKKSMIENNLDDLKTELTVYKERLIEEKTKMTKLIDEGLAKDRTIDNLLKENEDQRQQMVKLKARAKGLEQEIESEKVTIKAMEKSFNDQLNLEKRKAFECRQELHDMMIKNKEEKEILVKDLEQKQIHELESLERRIKGVLDRKDREIEELRQDVIEKENMCMKYEELLDKQRRDLLGNLG
jgi:5-azacytidine-induced protein 1